LRRPTGRSLREHRPELTRHARPSALYISEGSIRTKRFSFHSKL
jgi:hypothetical protein